MNKKGFSLIELIVVIAIIGLLLSIAVISYTSFIKKSNDLVYETYMDEMARAATMYLIDNRIIDEKRLSINELNINSINNPKDINDKCENDSYVLITRDDKKDERDVNTIYYKYEVHLNCNDYHGVKNY